MLLVGKGAVGPGGIAPMGGAASMCATLCCGKYHCRWERGSKKGSGAIGPGRKAGGILTRRRLGVVTLIFFLGIIVGSVFSQAIGLFLPEGGTAHQLFVQYLSFGFGPGSLDLIVFDITVGFHIHVNLLSVIGIFLVAQLLRWYR